MWKRAVSDCRGQGTDGLGGEYAGNGELWSSSSVGCASSAVASVYPGGLDGDMCAGLGYVGLDAGWVIFGGVELSI